MIQATYYALFLISLLYVVILMTIFRRHISVYFILLSISVVIVNLGFLQISGAQTLEAALVGNQVVYLASALLTLFMVAVISNLCRVYIPFR